jgi:hypothetical protein
MNSPFGEPSLRGVQRRGNPALDCFAALAMTKLAALYADSTRMLNC